MNIGIIIQLGFLTLNLLFCLYQWHKYRQTKLEIMRIREEKRLEDEEFAQYIMRERDMMMGDRPDTLSPLKKVGKHKMN